MTATQMTEEVVVPSSLLDLVLVTGDGLALADLVLEHADAPEHIRKLATKFRAEAEAALGRVTVGG